MGNQIRRSDGRECEKIIPVAWANWDEVDDFLIFSDTVFTDDFGPIKKDTEFDVVQVSYTNGILEALNDTDVVHSLKIVAKVVAERSWNEIDDYNEG